ISRAQVYRFLDCAVVLKQLRDFRKIPTRERLCRSLKRFAKSRTDLRLLWARVLEAASGNDIEITSTMIASVWREAVRSAINSSSVRHPENAVQADQSPPETDEADVKFGGAVLQSDALYDALEEADGDAPSHLFNPEDVEREVACWIKQTGSRASPTGRDGLQDMWDDEAEPQGNGLFPRGSSSGNNLALMGASAPYRESPFGMPDTYVHSAGGRLVNREGFTEAEVSFVRSALELVSSRGYDLQSWEETAGPTSASEEALDQGRHPADDEMQEDTKFAQPSRAGNNKRRRSQSRPLPISSVPAPPDKTARLAKRPARARRKKPAVDSATTAAAAEAVAIPQDGGGRAARPGPETTQWGYDALADPRETPLDDVSLARPTPPPPLRPPLEDHGYHSHHYHHRMHSGSLLGLDGPSASGAGDWASASTSGGAPLPQQQPPQQHQHQQQHHLTLASPPSSGPQPLGLLAASPPRRYRPAAASSLSVLTTAVTPPRAAPCPVHGVTPRSAQHSSAATTPRVATSPTPLLRTAQLDHLQASVGALAGLAAIDLARYAAASAPSSSAAAGAAQPLPPSPPGGGGGGLSAAAVVAAAAALSLQSLRAQYANPLPAALRRAMPSRHLEFEPEIGGGGDDPAGSAAGTATSAA
ncbi:hypothetical protein HK405_010812, partial [Cladochytrium tenue]